MTDKQTGNQTAKEAGVPPETAPPSPSPPPRLLTWAARHGYGLLALVCLFLWLPGVLSLPALDRDESRFAQSSRQMLDSGNYVDIRFGKVPRYKKPVGIYWLQAAATAVATTATGPLNRDGQSDGHIWTYRLPSLLGATLAVWLTFWSASLFGAEAALLAGLLLAASILLTAEATIAATDAVLLASVTGMQGVLLRVWRAAKEAGPSPSRRMVLAGWAAMAVGILVKGPVAPAVAAATVIVLMTWHWLEHRKEADGRWDWRWLVHLKPVQGLLLTVLLTAPWLLAISLESHGAFLHQSLGDDFAAKIAGGQESHGAPPGYFVLLAALTFWPAILFVTPGLGLAVTRRNEPAIRFLIAWAAGWWLVVEAVPTKLPQYVLPSYPALTILAGLWLLTPKIEPAPKSNPTTETDAVGQTPEPRKRDWRRILSVIAVLQFLIGLAVLVGAPFLLPKYFGAGPASWPVMAIASVAGLCGIAALAIFLRGRRLMSVIPALAAAFIIIPTLTGFVGPALSQLWVTERLAALVAKDRQPSDPPPMLAGYEEPSMLFALGADIALTDGRGAAERGANQGGIALIQDDERPKFLARLAELEDSAVALDDLSGFNYSRGKTVHITLYRVAPLHPVTAPHVQ